MSWLNIKDVKPENNEWYLIYDSKFDDIILAKWDNGWHVDNYGLVDNSIEFYHNLPDKPSK